MHRCAGKILLQTSEQAVLGPEVVAPLADAVGLVDGDETDACICEPFTEPTAPVTDKAFGRDVQQAAAATPDQRHRGTSLMGRLRTVDARRCHTARHEAVDLILHQRDERGHDERERCATRGVVEQRGRLETQ
jgi:hypothetical protein